jgi:hypothetical protein
METMKAAAIAGEIDPGSLGQGKPKSVIWTKALAGAATDAAPQKFSSCHETTFSPAFEEARRDLRRSARGNRTKRVQPPIAA